MVTQLTVPIAENWLHEFCRNVIDIEDYLNELDRAVGDGEHGSNICNGARVLQESLMEHQFNSLGNFFEYVGMTLVNSVGGASGALYGTLFLRLSDVTKDRTSVSLEVVWKAFESALAGIMELGRVKPGDKTLVDALNPAVESLAASVKNSVSMPDAFVEAYRAADLGRANTAQLEATKGRGSYQGERSINHIDPGATSMTVLFLALSRSVNSIGSDGH